MQGRGDISSLVLVLNLGQNSKKRPQIHLLSTLTVPSVPEYPFRTWREYSREICMQSHQLTAFYSSAFLVREPDWCPKGDGLLQSDSAALKEAARAIEEWPVYVTCNAQVARACSLEECDSYAVGTSFDCNGRQFIPVPSSGHKAFTEGSNLTAQLLNFVKTEQLPPYLPYSSSTNERIFAMDRQVKPLPVIPTSIAICPARACLLPSSSALQVLCPKPC